MHILNVVLLIQILKKLKQKLHAKKKKKCKTKEWKNMGKFKGFNPSRNKFEREKYETVESGPNKEVDKNAIANPELEIPDPVLDGTREAEEEHGTTRDL
ncbi:MAG: hypothetical protein ACTSW3_01645 [Promethearchaeota archaeon]